MTLVLSRGAARQLEQILDYIAEQNPQAAHHVQARIRAVMKVLLQLPEAGSTTSVAGLRRIVVTPYPYAIFYRVVGETVIVQRIRHTSRRPLS